MARRTDEQVLGVCSDVVIRFKAHDAYRTEANAMKALARRAPGRAAERYRTAFALLCRVYDRAVSAVARYQVNRPDKKSRFAEPEDIDQRACLAELNEIEPGTALRQKEAILGWVIYWHYLR